MCKFGFFCDYISVCLGIVAGQCGFTTKRQRYNKFYLKKSKLIHIGINVMYNFTKKILHKKLFRTQNTSECNL